MNDDQYSKAMNKVIARAWADEAFHDLLLADPAKALRAMGWQIPAGLKVTVFQNTDQEFHLALPVKPLSTQFTEESLDQIPGGIPDGSTCTSGGCFDGAIC